MKGGWRTTYGLGRDLLKQSFDTFPEKDNLLACGVDASPSFSYNLPPYGSLEDEADALLTPPRPPPLVHVLLPVLGLGPAHHAVDPRDVYPSAYEVRSHQRCVRLELRRAKRVAWEVVCWSALEM